MKASPLQKYTCNSKRVQNINKEIPEIVSSKIFLGMSMLTDYAMLQTELSAKNVDAKSFRFAVAHWKTADQNNFS